MIKFSCMECGKEFEVYPSRAKKGEVKYCSRECSDNSKKEEPNVECYICSKPFHVKPYRLSRLKLDKICCSKECSHKLKETEYLGEKNHQYGLKGELNSSWKGDLKLTNYGYLALRDPNHPFRNSEDCVFLHRLLMEEFLRDNYPDSEYLIEIEGSQILYLDPNIVIHHKDGDKLNNTILNLEIMQLGDHTAAHNRERATLRDSKGKFIRNEAEQVGSKLSKRHTFDAGLDIKSNEEVVISPGERKLISTDLKIKVPNGQVGLIWSRSGLSVKHGIQVGAGCIDSTYRGEVKVLLYNLGASDFKIEVGDRIAQLLTIPINFNEYKDVDSLDETDRGEDGFGSTGRR